MGLDGKQQSMPRNGSSHPLEVVQIHEISTTLQTKTHGSDHREKEVQIADHFIMLGIHTMDMG